MTPPLTPPGTPPLKPPAKPGSPPKSVESTVLVVTIAPSKTSVSIDPAQRRCRPWRRHDHVDHQACSRSDCHRRQRSDRRDAHVELRRQHGLQLRRDARRRHRCARHCHGARSGRIVDRPVAALHRRERRPRRVDRARTHRHRHRDRQDRPPRSRRIASEARLAPSAGFRGSDR